MNVSVHENQVNFSQRLCDMFDVVGGSIEQKFSSSNRECQYEFRKVRYTYMLKYFKITEHYQLENKD